MPDKKAATDLVSGDKYHSRSDDFKGVWKLTLNLYCQEQSSIVIKDGVYTPSHVSQEADDSAIHFYQNQMHTV